MSSRKEKGQVLLIVVLVMVVALTVGLSLATRSITNLRVSVDDQNSQKAFSAAEAGVEQALKTGTTITTYKDLGNKAGIVSVDITDTTKWPDVLINNGSVIYQDDGADLWLTKYSSTLSQLYQSPYWNGNFSVYWGGSSDVCSTNLATNTMAAMQVFVISGTRGNPTIQRYVFDPCGGRASVNNFAPASICASSDCNLTTSAGVKHFAFQTSSIVVTNGLITRVVPLYASTVIGVHGSTSFPSQGRIIASKGSAGLGAGASQRKILYYQGYESVPSEFFYALLVPNP